MPISFDGFDIFAFFIFAVLLFAAAAIVVLLGSLPGRIAARRGHPYAAAVNAAAWVSLATLGALWPVAFVWAFLPWPKPAASEAGGKAA